MPFFSLRTYIKERGASGLLNLNSPRHDGGGGGERLSFSSSFIEHLAAPAHCDFSPNNHDNRVWGADFFWVPPPPNSGRSVSIRHGCDDDGSSSLDFVPLFASGDFAGEGEDGRLFLPRGAIGEREARCVVVCETSPEPDGGGGGRFSLSSTSIGLAAALVPCGSFPNSHDSKFGGGGGGVDFFRAPPPSICE